MKKYTYQHLQSSLISSYSISFYGELRAFSKMSHPFKFVESSGVANLLVGSSVTLFGFHLSLETTFITDFLGFKLFLGWIVSIPVSVTPEFRQFKLSGKHNKITVSAI